MRPRVRGRVVKIEKLIEIEAKLRPKEFEWLKLNDRVVKTEKSIDNMRVRDRGRVVNTKNFE